MKLKRKKSSQDSNKEVPAYIVTFSDMVTLLLTFFVLLLTLAEYQDPELFSIGRDSFVRSIKSLGLGMFFGMNELTTFESRKAKYPVEEPAEPADLRIINSRKEKTEELFNQLCGRMQVLPAQIYGKSVDFEFADIHFEKGKSTLDSEGREYLSRFCSSLQRNKEAGCLQLYVLGLSNEGENSRENFYVSAKRGRAVASFLRREIPDELDWPVYCWGAGCGGKWVGRHSPISSGCQIVLGVVRVSD